MTVGFVIEPKRKEGNLGFFNNYITLVSLMVFTMIGKRIWICL
jgi:hypothetical protein